MKLFISTILISFQLLPSISAQKAIQISKPLFESIKPDALYWTFDNGTLDESFPLLVEDQSGNGYDGKLRAGDIHSEPIYVDGKFGTALHFPGPTPPLTLEDGRTRTRTNPSVQWSLADTPGVWEETALDMDSKDFTAGFWIKLDNVEEGQRQTLFLMWRGRESSQWHFALLKDTRDQWAYRMGREESTVKTNVLNDGEWHHIAFSFKVNNGENLITFWLDGEIFGDPIVTSTSISAPSSARDRIFIFGERPVANHSTGFSGAVDDVFVTSGVHTFAP